MKYLNNELLIPFNIKDKSGLWYDKNSFQSIDLEKVVQKGLFGSMGYVESTINLSEISHQIINIEIRNSGIYGDIRVLDFGYGRHLSEIIDKGINVVFRYVGMSSQDSNGYSTVFEIWGFPVMGRKDDIYDEIVWRGNKLKKILKKIHA